MNLASMNRHKYTINHQTGAVFWGNEELCHVVRDGSGVALKERILSLCCARLVKMLKQGRVKWVVQSKVLPKPPHFIAERGRVMCFTGTQCHFMANYATFGFYKTAM